MKPTVVIADDDADIRALIALSVSKAGAVLVAELASGGAALQAIRQHSPDLAILDISMPEMTGLEVCRAVRADPATRDLRIMMLSAAVQPAAVAEGLAAGADAYETKPFSPKRLSARIREILQPRASDAKAFNRSSRCVAGED